MEKKWKWNKIKNNDNKEHQVCLLRNHHVRMKTWNHTKSMLQQNAHGWRVYPHNNFLLYKYETNNN
jgi:hypothetical protein